MLLPLNTCNYFASQCLSAVYTVLSDESKRGLYDESGEVCITKSILEMGFKLGPFQKVEDESDPLSDPNKDWVDYWRNLFPKVKPFIA